MAISKFSIDIDSATPVPENSLERWSLIRALGEMAAVVPLIRFRVRTETTPPPPAGYLAFTYRFECVDGRVWDETHSYPDPPNGDPPFMDVKGGAYPSAADLGQTIVEIALQRPIRDLVFKMVPQFGITDLHAKWV